MSHAPHKLVDLEEDPRSGREKVIVLTVDGEACLRAMVGRGEAFIERIIEHMNADEIISGIHFFERIRAIVAELDN